MPKEWIVSPTLQGQIANFDQADIDELARLKRTIIWQFNEEQFRPHPLQGRGDQGILDGCYAMDFNSRGNNPGRWRLLYDVDNLIDKDNFKITLHAILDYHGGLRYAPLYKGGNIDLSG